MSDPAGSHHEPADAHRAEGLAYDARFGPYLLQKELGRGGQGVVFRAVDTRLSRAVAIKIGRRADHGEAQRDRRRFEREAGIAAKVDHPGICTIYEAGEIDGRFFIAMRLIDGESLEQRLRRRRSRGGEIITFHVDLLQSTGVVEAAMTPTPIPGPVAVEPGAAPLAADDDETPSDRRRIKKWLVFFEQCSRALDALHAAGVVHRDIKPANIMIDRSGRPVLMDFGVARSDAPELLTLTSDGQVFGTPNYMSPEQIAPEKVALDGRTDIWSLGVTMYETLTLSRPFEGSTQNVVLNAIQNTEPRDPRRLNPGISRDLKVVLETALSKDRSRRYRTAAALADDLAALIAGRPVAARPIGTFRRAARWVRRSPTKATLIALLFLFLPIVAAFTTHFYSTADERRRAHEIVRQDEQDELLADAYFELLEGSPARAERDFKKILDDDPSSAEAAGGWIFAQIRRGDYAAATQSLAAADPIRGRWTHRFLTALATSAERLTIVPQESDAHSAVDATDFFFLAQAALEAGERGRAESFKDAVRWSTRAILASRRPRLLYFVSRAHAIGHISDHEIAVESAESLRLHWPQSGVAAFWAGFALVPTHLTDRAIEEFSRAVAKKTRLGTSHYNLAILHDLVKKSETALVHARLAVEHSPDDARMHYAVAQAAKNSKKFEEAEAALKKALSLDPMQADAHFLAAEFAFARGDHDDVVRHCRTIVETAPNRSDAWFALGTSLVMLKKSDEAVDAFKKVIELDPKHYEAYLNLGTTYFHVARYEESAVALEKATSLAPDRAQGWYNLGNSLSRKKDYKAAVRAYRRATEADAKDPDHWRTLAVHLLFLETWDEAVVALEAIDRLGAANAVDLGRLARSLDRIGETVRALTVARRIVEKWPDDVDGLRTLGSMLLHRDELAEAARHIEKSLEIGGTDVELKAALDGARKTLDDDLLIAKESANNDNVQSVFDEHRRAEAALRSGEPGRAADLFIASARDGRLEKAPQTISDLLPALRAACRAHAGMGDAKTASPDRRGEYQKHAYLWAENIVELIEEKIEEDDNDADWSLRRTLRMFAVEPEFSSIRPSATETAIGPVKNDRLEGLWRRIERARRELNPRNLAPSSRPN